MGFAKWKENIWKQKTERIKNKIKDQHSVRNCENANESEWIKIGWMVLESQFYQSISFDSLAT